MLDTIPRPRTVDARVPVFTVVPQVVATLAMAGTPATAQLTFLLALGIDLPLAITTRWSRRDPSWVLPGVALAWAAACRIVVPGALGPQAVGAATAAAWCAMTISFVLFVVPGPWSPRGAVIHLMRSVGVATHREVVAYAAGRLVLLGLAAGSLLLVTIPWLAALVGAVVLLVLPLDDARDP